jgi:hypothetical protein
VRPSAMTELIEVLNHAGSDALLISFSQVDHQTSTTVWEADMLKGYALARSLADEQNVPLYFLGFSLGALVSQYLLSLRIENIQFDKQIFLAPATAIKIPRILKSCIPFLGDNLKIPSYTPKKYRLNEWLPAKIYKQMMYWERTILKKDGDHLNIPTLIIIDPKDELISYATIRKQIARFRLTNYQCITLESSLRARSTRYHHLIIDEATMGKNNWAVVTNKLIEFLNL